eukprot:GEMP01057476.1.p1 GENE.GEMP01057476.1~~GEMP01057476.1.p1  ORF type:complete len:145 (+),score=9.26 GEMP01057476.1:160-594(+)
MGHGQVGVKWYHTCVQSRPRAGVPPEPGASKDFEEKVQHGTKGMKWRASNQKCTHQILHHSAGSPKRKGNPCIVFPSMPRLRAKKKREQIAKKHTIFENKKVPFFCFLTMGEKVPQIGHFHVKYIQRAAKKKANSRIYIFVTNS